MQNSRKEVFIIKLGQQRIMSQITHNNLPKSSIHISLFVAIKTGHAL